MNTENFNNTVCPICLCDVSLPTTLSCNHTFCYLCIKNIPGDNCPCCRKVFNKIETRNEVAKEAMKSGTNNWSYQGRKRGWWDFSNEHSSELEEAYQRFLRSDNSSNYKLELVPGTFLVIDFIAMTQMNMKTNATRQIKRNEVTQSSRKSKGMSGLLYKQSDRTN